MFSLEIHASIAALKLWELVACVPGKHYINCILCMDAQLYNNKCAEKKQVRIPEVSMK